MKKIGKGLRYSSPSGPIPSGASMKCRFENQGNVVSCLLLLVLLVLAFIARASIPDSFSTRSTKESTSSGKSRRGDTGLALVRGQLVHHRPDGRGGPIRGYFYGHLLRDGALHHRHFHWGDYEPFHDGGRKHLHRHRHRPGVAFTALLLFCGILDRSPVHGDQKRIFHHSDRGLGMAFIVFLALLFASIFDKLFSYVAGIFTEIQLRM